LCVLFPLFELFSTPSFTSVGRRSPAVPAVAFFPSSFGMSVGIRLFHPLIYFSGGLRGPLPRGASSVTSGAIHWAYPFLFFSTMRGDVSCSEAPRMFPLPFTPPPIRFFLSLCGPIPVCRRSLRGWYFHTTRFTFPCWKTMHVFSSRFPTVLP